MAISSELLKKAEKAESLGDHAQAAELYERGGDVEHAITAHRRAGSVDRAAVLYERTGRGVEAATLLMSMGQPLQAAVIFERYRAYSKAASALLRGNQRERAAAMFEKAELYDDAAKIYASLGNHRRALQLYEKSGNAQLANELRASMEPGSADAGAAETVLELDPSMEIVADQYLDAQLLVDAVVAHLKGGRVQDAAQLYENCSEDIGYSILAAVAGDHAVERHAADMFMAARDFAKAGQIFENLEDYASAGSMFERADDPYMAAEMYVRGGDRTKAAEMYEKYGNFKQAAEFFLETKSFEKAALNFEKAMNNFVAGKLYFRMNKTNKSLQLLQKVQSTEREYFDACRLIGEILAANGYVDLAVRKYLEVVEASPLSKDTANIYYDLGRALERRGELDRAKAIYDKLVSWQFDYQDVAARVKALAAGTPLDGPPPAAAAAAAVAPPPSIKPVEAPAAPRAKPAAVSPKVAAEASGNAPQVVSMMGGFEFLKKTPLFSDLTLEEMKAVYNACETRHFEAGEALIEQGQPGDALYVLRKGKANVVKVGETETVVARLGPGSPAGEMALIDDAPTSARVVAESAVDAFVITRARFEKLLAANDRTAVKLFRFFVQTLAKRLRSTSESLAAAKLSD